MMSQHYDTMKANFETVNNFDKNAEWKNQAAAIREKLQATRVFAPGEREALHAELSLVYNQMGYTNNPVVNGVVLSPGGARRTVGQAMSALPASALATGASSNQSQTRK